VLEGRCECTVACPALSVLLTCCLRALMPYQVEDNARALEQIEAALADLRNDLHKQLSHSDKTRASQSATTTAKPTTVSGDAPLHRGDGSDDNDNTHASTDATGDAVSTNVPGTRTSYCWHAYSLRLAP
jgi:Tfp pilus assembly protein PilX